MIKIICDSICDLPADIIAKYNIRVIPLAILKGEQTFRDGVDITPQDIFDYVESGKGICHTGAVNIEEYRAVYAEEQGKTIIHFCISAELSACANNAKAAAAEFDNVYVVDTRLLSGGSAMLALCAAEMAEQGASVDAILTAINAKIERSETSFVVDTLKYLQKGGRCSGLAALGANLLNIKPCLELTDGKIIPGKKYRGNIDRVYKQYIDDKLKGRTDIDLSLALIVHTIADTAKVDALAEYVRELQPFKRVLVWNAGCTISNHCGPGTMGVLIQCIIDN